MIAPLSQRGRVCQHRNSADNREAAHQKEAGAALVPVVRPLERPAGTVTARQWRRGTFSASRSRPAVGWSGDVAPSGVDSVGRHVVVAERRRLRNVSPSAASSAAGTACAGQGTDDTREDDGCANDVTKTHFASARHPARPTFRCDEGRRQRTRSRSWHRPVRTRPTRDGRTAHPDRGCTCPDVEKVCATASCDGFPACPCPKTSAAAGTAPEVDNTAFVTRNDRVRLVDLAIASIAKSTSSPAGTGRVLCVRVHIRDGMPTSNARRATSTIDAFSRSRRDFLARQSSLVRSRTPAPPIPSRGCLYFARATVRIAR